LKTKVLVCLLFLTNLINPSTHFAQDSATPVFISIESSLEKALELFRDGQLRESRRILNALDQAGQLNEDGYLALAYIEFWDGFPTRAKLHLGNISSGYQNIQDVEFLHLQIDNQLRFRLDLTYGATDDNQPLNTSHLRVDVSLFKNRYLNPDFSLVKYSFDTQGGIYHSIKFVGQNTIRTGLTGHSLNTSLGFYVDDDYGRFNLLGGVKYSHKLTSNIFVNGEVKREPYLHHNRNLASVFFTNQIIGGLRYEKENIYYSEIKYQRWIFADDNWQDIFSFYYVRNLLQVNAADFYIGYALNYSHANESRFIVGQNGINPEKMESVSGNYFPYYTPYHDQSHSIVLSGKLNAGKSLTATADLKYGVYSTAKQPFYFYPSDESLGVIMGTYDLKYNPLEISGKITYRISNRIELQAHYAYKRLKYYTLEELFTSLRIEI